MTVHVICPTCGCGEMKGFHHLRRPGVGGVIVWNDPGIKYLDHVDFHHSDDWKLVVVPKRIGYINAVNLGYRVANPEPDDVVVVLNDDVEILGDILTPMVAALEKGAAQVGPSLRYVGKDGGWGQEGDTPYAFLEGWLWAAKASTLFNTGTLGEVYDEGYLDGFCEDVDLSIRIIRDGGTLQSLDLTIVHHRSQTYGQNRPTWERNRMLLVERWGLDR